MTKDTFDYADKETRILLGSGSPRRQELLKQMGIPFQVVLKNTEETYPSNLSGTEIAEYIAKKKASAFSGEIKNKDVLLTADTVVWHQKEHLAKAKNKQEAQTMLKQLSGSWHDVITGVCFTTAEYQDTLHDITRVKFKNLSEQEIDYYIQNFSPYDKAGAYGIQEWLGLIGIEEIHGSYSNVVGLPTQKVFDYLSKYLHLK